MLRPPSSAIFGSPALSIHKMLKRPQQCIIQTLRSCRSMPYTVEPRSQAVADGIRRTMAAYIGLKPHMDVITHHTTIAGEFAMTRSQWLIKGIDNNGQATEVHHHGMEVHRRLPDGSWVFFIDHPFGADPGWAVEAPPPTE